MNEWRIPMSKVAKFLFDILKEIPVLGHHSIQVAKLSAFLAKKMEFPAEKRVSIFLLGGLHDIGLIAPKIRNKKAFEILENSRTDPEGIVNVMKDDAIFKDHGPIGARIIEMIPSLADCSDVIYHHHTAAIDLDISHSALVANTVMMADAISLRLMTRSDVPDPEFVEDVRSYIKSSRALFFPDVREAADEILMEEGYMMLAADDMIHWDEFVGVEVGIDSATFASIMGVVDFLVDSKTDRTKHHSTRVAFLARELGKEMLSDSESFGLFLAGRLHDVGKIFVPSDVLERSRDGIEDFIYRTHVIHTYRLLSELEAFQSIVTWAVTHHERMDGTGYPWRLSSRSMSIPARILQVSDTYVTLIERGSTDPLEEISSMAELGKFDPAVVETLNRLIKGGYDVTEVYDLVEMYMEEVERDERDSKGFDRNVRAERS